jgi:hypothetical protein
LSKDHALASAAGASVAMGLTVERISPPELEGTKRPWRVA